MTVGKADLATKLVATAASLERSDKYMFLSREDMLSAVYAVVMCLCVCLCVCLSHSGIVSQRLNVGSRKQRRTIAP